METNKEFVDYYAERSLKDLTVERFSRVKDAILRIRTEEGTSNAFLTVGDVGCNAGTQCNIWAREGHQVHGVDISSELIDLARSRSNDEGLSVVYDVGDAEHLPWNDASIDVCLVPELLEHVGDWRPCLDEFSRVLKPGGTLYLSTSNRLCPKQQEYNLPLYSWYPKSLKRRYERMAVTTRPDLVNYAKFPAVHWFTYYQLRRELMDRGLESQDRFDMMYIEDKNMLKRAIIWLIKASPLIRYLGHVCTPATVVLATKRI